MLKSLVKKQFLECFQSYFVNSKTGKARTKASKIGMFLLYGLVFIVLFIAFLGISYSLIPVLSTDNNWLYFTIMGSLAILLGIFGSVFSTYSFLYLAKDNDLLLSMPIKPSNILISRIVLVFGLSFLYSSVAWLPAVVIALTNGYLSIIAIVFSLVSTLAIALFVSTLTCAIGYLVALISTKLKNKNIISVILVLAFLGVYYYFSFNLENLAGSLVANSNLVAEKLTLFANVLCQLGKGAMGNSLGFAIFSLVSIVLFVLCFYILSRSFINVALASNNVASSSKKIVFSKQSSMKTTLLKREAKRFSSSTLYMLNCGLGVVFVLAIGVMLFIKQNDIKTLLELFQSEFPIIGSFIPLVIIFAINMIISVDCISTPSISLEGKTLWILKSLPVYPSEVFEAKERLHLFVNAIPSVIVASFACLMLNIEAYISVSVVIIVVLLIDINAVIGLILGLLRPNFAWTNEAQPIKQSINVLLSMLISWVITAAIGVGYYFLSEKLEIKTYLAFVELFAVIVLILMKRWLRTKGSVIFTNL